jgi:hypothetical protein
MNDCDSCLYSKNGDCSKKGFDLGAYSFMPIFNKDNSRYTLDSLIEFNKLTSDKKCFDYKKFQE